MEKEDKIAGRMFLKAKVMCFIFLIFSILKNEIKTIKKERRKRYSINSFFNLSFIQTKSHFSNEPKSTLICISLEKHVQISTQARREALLKYWFILFYNYCSFLKYSLKDRFLLIWDKEGEREKFVASLMCSDLESNLQLFGVRDNAPTNWATRQGKRLQFFNINDTNVFPNNNLDIFFIHL